MQFDDPGMIQTLHNADFPFNALPIDGVLKDREKDLLKSIVFSMKLDSVDLRKSPLIDILLFFPLVCDTHRLLYSSNYKITYNQPYIIKILLSSSSLSAAFYRCSSILVGWETIISTSRFRPERS